MSNSLFAFIHVTLPQWIAWHLPRRVVLFDVRRTPPLVNGATKLSRS